MTEENKMVVGHPYSHKNHPAHRHYTFVRLYSPEKGIFSGSGKAVCVLSYEDMTTVPMTEDGRPIHVRTALPDVVWKNLHEK